MRRPALLLITFLLLLGTASGCTAGDKIGEVTEKVVDETVEAYENVANKLSDLKTWIQEKWEQAIQAKEDIEEATDSVNEAVDDVNEAVESVKEFTGTNEEAEDTATTSSETTDGVSE